MNKESIILINGNTVALVKITSRLIDNEINISLSHKNALRVLHRNSLYSYFTDRFFDQWIIDYWNTETPRQQALICFICLSSCHQLLHDTWDVSRPLMKNRHFTEILMQVCFASQWIFSRLTDPLSSWRESAAEQKVLGVVTAAFKKVSVTFFKSNVKINQMKTRALQGGAPFHFSLLLCITN